MTFLFFRRGARSLTVAATIAAACAVLASHSSALEKPAADPVGAAPGQSRAAVFQRVRKLADIGRRVFADPALSASGQMSCATCHDPAKGFSPANALAVQLGGKNMDQAGLRAAPSLTYLQTTPRFTEHFHESDDDGDESVDAGPTGGLMWDGRVDQVAAQALFPLFSVYEMANEDHAALARLIDAKYGAELRATMEGTMSEGEDFALRAAAKALQAYQETPAAFFPYSSKYDFYLRGAVALTDQEKHGLELFNDEKKGNCASCHFSAQAKPGVFPQFSDAGFIALGLPRNKDIPRNADPAFFDLGLCGPERLDVKDSADYCGTFKAPSLRNVALRQSFFHNGVFHDLREAVAFYVERDVKPEKYYPRRIDGSVDKFNDLPPQYRANINNDPPFGGKPGDKPAMTDAEIDDVVAFLKTLTDGYAPPSPEHAAR
ncbi:cytochrome-c peroxidase [Methylocella silvestris]|uniref:Cytochrome-c peroxidase n=1 Tax=Methylocella silvestris TaxID=199596 RepID=A0A2J7TIH0_METSI|nr:cytochrome c peroxidase [Methylocella silvestris]PNG26572.1 cytochrome-c peroxidase [Methylocella silvestris]